LIQAHRAWRQSTVSYTNPIQYVSIATTHLKSSHIPRVAGILQAVLIALHEKLEEKSKTDHILSLSISINLHWIDDDFTYTIFEIQAM